jgi:ABC-type tungstate transport system permease subunit
VASKNDTITRRVIAETKERDAQTLQHMASVLQGELNSAEEFVSWATQQVIQNTINDFRVRAKVKWDAATDERRKL